MDKESKKALDDKYGVPEEVEDFAAEVADKQDNPTLHELAKTFPDKTYKELEKYRDEDRQKEASQIPLTEAQKNLVDHIEAGVCVTGALRKDLVGYREYQKEHKLRQEAEGELSIIKGIETNRVKESEIRCNHLQDELDRVKKENNDLFLRIAELTEVEESHRKMNGKLQERLTEVEEENKKLNEHVDKHITGARKSGM